MVSLARCGRGTRGAQLQLARAGEDLTHASSMAREILRGRASLSVVFQPIICRERCKSAVISARAGDRLIGWSGPSPPATSDDSSNEPWSVLRGASSSASSRSPHDSTSRNCSCFDAVACRAASLMESKSPPPPSSSDHYSRPSSCAPGRKRALTTPDGTPSMAVKLEAFAMDGKRRREAAVSLLQELRSTGAVRALPGDGVHQDVKGGAARPSQRSDGDGAASAPVAAASGTQDAGTKGALPAASDAAAGGSLAAAPGGRAAAQMPMATPAGVAPAVESIRGGAPPAVDACRRAPEAAAGANQSGATPVAVGSWTATLPAPPSVVADADGRPHAGFSPPDAGVAGRATLAILGFRSYAPAQVAAAVAAVACVHLTAERQMDLTRAISLAADEGTIDGNVVLDAPEEEVMTALLALSRRTCRGTIPLGTRVRVLRFIRAQR